RCAAPPPESPPPKRTDSPPYSSHSSLVPWSLVPSFPALFIRQCVNRILARGHPSGVDSAEQRTDKGDTCALRNPVRGHLKRHGGKEVGHQFAHAIGAADAQQDADKGQHRTF